MLGSLKHSAPKNNRRKNRTQLGVEVLEGRDVPSTLIYSGTFDWNGVASVTETVTQDAPGYEGQYLWDYHVTNESFASGISTFAVPVEDSSMVSNLSSSVGWLGSIGTLLSDPDLIAWQAPAPIGGGGSIGLDGVSGGGMTTDGPGLPPPPPPGLAIGQSADFTFTTAPTAIGLTYGFVSDPNLVSTPGGFVAVPIEGEPPPPEQAPPPALLVSTDVDKDDASKVGTSLREAINYINENGNAQSEQRIAFAEGLDGKSISLNQILPAITKNIYIDGRGIDVTTIERDATKGSFGLLWVKPGATLKIRGATLSNGYVDFGFNGLSGGGAIYSQGTLTVDTCKFYNNTAAGDANNMIPGHGGAIWASSGSVSIYSSAFVLNGADFGGAVGTDQGVFLRADDSEFFGNTATKSGGALYIGAVDDNQFNTIITHTDFVSNTAGASGGGIYSDDAILKLTGNTDFRSNGAVKGGGVCVSGGEVIYDGVSFGGNTASDVGDGVYRFKATRTNGPGGVTWYGDPTNSETAVP